MVPGLTPDETARAVDSDHVIGYHVNSDQGSAAMVGEFLPMPEDLTEAEKARLEEIRQASSSRA